MTMCFGLCDSGSRPERKRSAPTSPHHNVRIPLPSFILNIMAHLKSRTEIRIAIDSGGTFTDCVWLERTTLRILKVFSTPADPSQAIAEAVHKIAGSARSVIVLHGTTVGTNTLLQRKGARVAFVTTAGFEDSVEIGCQHRPRLYD